MGRATPEGKIKARVRARLKREFDIDGWAYWPVQTMFSGAGLDIFFCLHGRFVAIETKAAFNKKPTDRQQDTISKIRRAGGLVFVVYDDWSLDLMIEWLKKIRANEYGPRLRIQAEPIASGTPNGADCQPLPDSPRRAA